VRCNSVPGRSGKFLESKKSNVPSPGSRLVSRSSPSRLIVSPQPPSPDRPNRHQKLAIAPLVQSSAIMLSSVRSLALPQHVSNRAANPLAEIVTQWMQLRLTKRMLEFKLLKLIRSDT
jgi:hypothetical protein